MVIKASSGKEIDALIADLASDVAATRDAAVARLTVIGQRAVVRLLALTGDRALASSVRVAAFRSLESIGDARALDPALTCMADPDGAVAIAALDVARTFLKAPRGLKVLDHITSIALDRQRPTAVRLAAIKALSDLEPATVKPVLDTLKTDPDPELARALEPIRSRATPVDSTQRLLASAGGVLEDATVLRRAIARSSADVPETALRQIIDRVRVREGTEPASTRLSWMAVRGAAHAALAQRGSRIALYDLRETIEAARQPVPGEFLAALTAIGDASCLEPIASAYAHATSAQPPDDWWRRHLADAFRHIIGREKITRRHAVIKKIEKRWKGTFESLVVSR